MITKNLDKIQKKLTCIDTHAHLFMLKKDEAAVIKQAREAGLSAIINVAVDLDSAKEALRCSKTYPGFVYATCGIHPLYAERFDQLEALNVFAVENQKDIVAIGEAGLDYKYGKDNKADQLRVLEAQFELAEALKKPIIIHNRFTNEDVAAMMNRYPKVKSVIHCFVESVDFLETITHGNYFISFTGIITNRLTKPTEEVIQCFPLERMMIETDCPYLTPKVLGRVENEPAYVPEVARVLSDLRAEPIERISEVTTQNARAFFGIA